MLLCEGKNAFQSSGAVVNSLQAREPFAVPAEGDDMGGAGLRSGGNELAIDLYQGIVVFPAVEGPLDATQSAVVFRGSGNRTGEAEGFDSGDFARMKEVDALQSEVCGAFGEFPEGEVIEAPAADGLGVRHEGRRVESVVFPPGAQIDEQDPEDGAADESQDDKQGESDLDIPSHQVDGDGSPVEGCHDNDDHGSHEE